jgi:nicotinamide-nucleotide amidase
MYNSAMEDLFKLAEKVVHNATEKGIILSIAESCSGGLGSYILTSVSGSSAVFDRGFITYSYESKTELLGVNKNTLATHGAVSGECVEEMALGAGKNSRANLSVSISGIAGPEGGLPEKPVGLVYFGYFDKQTNKIRTEKKQFQGDRNSIRMQSAKRAMELFLMMMNEH